MLVGSVIGRAPWFEMVATRPWEGGTVRQLFSIVREREAERRSTGYRALSLERA